MMHPGKSSCTNQDPKQMTMDAVVMPTFYMKLHMICTALLHTVGFCKQESGSPWVFADTHIR